MDNNLQQGADNGLSHTNTTTNGGGDIEKICNGNDGASSQKNSNDGASTSNTNVVLPPEGMLLLCLFYVCLYTFNLTYTSRVVFVYYVGGIRI